MRRLDLRLNYHDSELVAAEWTDDDDLRLSFQLDGSWNYGSSHVQAVLFMSVRNRDEVEQALEEVEAAPPHGKSMADVVAIARSAPGTYLVETSQGAISIKAGGVVEC